MISPKYPQKKTFVSTKFLKNLSFQLPKLGPPVKSIEHLETAGNSASWGG